MRIFKATTTLDGYLPPLEYTENQEIAEVLLVGGKRFDLSDFPRLKGIFKTGVGTDNLPYAEALELDIDIAIPSDTTCEVIYEETASFSCHLILAGLFARCGDWELWKKFDRDALRNQRLLVVGAGRIGSRVARRMGPFMEVDTYDAAVDSPASLQQKVQRADCVSLHVPLTRDTEGLFNSEHLSWMKDGALIVNTARGGVVDEDALYEELVSGRLRAALDVFWEEPYRGKLAEVPLEGLMLTPHIASTCREFIEGTASDFLTFLNKIERASRGLQHD